VLILVVVLAVTNLATVGVLARLLLRRLDHPGPSRSVAAVLDAAPPPELSSSATRQIISIEILNPIELAGSRGRWAGLAGSLVPGITRRVVYDQAVKMVRKHLLDEKVVADVRVHTVRPAPRPPARPAPSGPAPSGRTPSGRTPSRAEQPRPGPAVVDEIVDVRLPPEPPPA
jgi:hypothetical protein